METLKQKIDREFLQQVDEALEELNAFTYTKKNMKLNKTNRNVILEEYKKILKSSNIACEHASLREDFLFEIRYKLNMKYVKTLQSLELSEQFILIAEYGLTHVNIDVEEEERIDIEEFIYNLMKCVSLTELTESYISERVAEEKLELLDRISDYKLKLHANMTNSERYKKMIDKKHKIYRGAILKALNTVAKEIGVNHNLEETELSSYSEKYKKGFRHEIKISI